MTPVPSDDDLATVFASGTLPPAAPDQAAPDTLAGDTTGLPPGGVRQASPTKEAKGPLDVGQQFSARYLIVRLLGIGGMGAVYQAWDAELSVMVALKVVRPEVTRDATAARDIERRFKQELLLARQVTHRNVVRIHDLGEIDGIKYITMPYIEGEDLSSVLKKSGRLPVTSVMPIARQIAAGLQAAHDAGIVHRDLKPANVMLEKDAEAIIMDFGIARTAAHTQTSVTGKASPGKLEATLEDAVTRAAATMAGAIVGTIEYMAPEQARGEPVDQRADIYAFGLMIYDMLVGRRRAEHAGSMIGELQKRLEQSPPPVRSIVPEIPEPLNRLVSRCIEPDAAKRYQTAADLVAALGRLDDNGKLRPIKKVVGLPIAAAVAILLLGTSAGIWWYQRQFIPAPVHDPVSVIIADFQNNTGDPSFDRTLEPILKLALEEASFVSAHDRTQLRGLGVQPPEVLNEQAAREIAVKQGLGIVLSGSLQRRGRAYVLSMKAIEAVTGNEIASVEDDVANKDRVLVAATGLAGDVREALGDEPSDSAQRFAMETLSATSLDVVREYAIAQQAASDGKFDEAREGFARAIALDSNFGYAYAAIGNALKNMGRLQEAEKSVNEALRYIDRMTERERLRTRGLVYLVTGDNEACLKEYGELIARYPADVSALNNVALCSTHLRDLPRAVEGMRRAVQILPRRALYRVNLALYAGYSGDFQTAEKESLVAQELGSPLGLLPLAFAQLAQGRLAEVLTSYETLAKAGAQGASFAASGLGDLALYEGRFSDAARIFQQGADQDMASGNTDKAARKFVALAQTEILRERRAAALAAGRTALTHSRAAAIRFLAARVFVDAGDLKEAQRLAAELASELQVEPQAYAKMIEGNIALANGEPRLAVKAFEEANTLVDTWIGRFDLGRAYFDLGRANSDLGAYTRADSEFDSCLTRRGEALAMLLDEEATYGFLPPVYYFQGRVRQELKTAAFAESYRMYLNIRGKSTEDRLVADVRARAGG